MHSVFCFPLHAGANKKKTQMNRIKMKARAKTNSGMLVPNGQPNALSE